MPKNARSYRHPENRFLGSKTKKIWWHLARKQENEDLNYNLVWFVISRLSGLNYEALK